MSVNKYRKHLIIIPEDDANRQIVIGFLLYDSIVGRAIQILPSAGGWLKAEEALKSQLGYMRNHQNCHILLIIDFDEYLTRRKKIREEIPEDIRNRIYILGSFSQPEDLKKEFGPYENIGRLLSEECLEEKWKIWESQNLKNNQSELTRLNKDVRPFVFKSISP